MKARPLTLLSLLFALTLFLGAGETPIAAGPDFSASVVQSELGIMAGTETVLPAGISTNWWAKVKEDIHQIEYQVTWQDQTYLPNLASAYQAPNRAHNLRTYFTPAGIRVIPRTSATLGSSWEWGLTLTGYGYVDNIQPVTAADLVVTGNRIEYRRETLTEWYVNDPRGLEQGFTLAAPPPSKIQNRTESMSTKSRITLNLALSGDLTPVLADNGQTVDFITSAGVHVLRYSDLHAYDATGRKLPAQLTLQSTQLTISIDTTAAVYPLIIDPLAISPNWTAESDQESAYFGDAVSTAGDVNGDGYDDVIVSATKYDNGQTDEGRVFVYHGSSSGLSLTSNWQAEINQDGALFGWTVGTAGDVNNDGYDDVIIGAVFYDNGQVDEGGAFVWYGSSIGLGANGDLANVDWRAESNQTGASFGISVGMAGDVNGDNYTDVIIGAYQYDNSQNNEGRAFVWYGGSGGLGANGTPANVDWRAESNQAEAWFGHAVGTAGDVNGDGFADIVVGAYKYDSGQQNEGKIFVWHGSSNGLGNNGAPGNADWKAESNQANASFGFSVGTAGDVNGDGYDDVIAGAYFYDNGQFNEGRAFVWHGSISGLGNNGKPGNADWKAESNKAMANYGWSAGTAGDVNGDGYDEVIVGAFLYNNEFQFEGRAFVYNGSAVGLNLTANWTAEGEQFNAGFGESVSTAGDVNGDGYTDIIVGAGGYSNGQTLEGRAFVYHGNGSEQPLLQSKPATTIQPALINQLYLPLIFKQE